MPVEVEGPGGVVVEFPDGTAPEVMRAAMQRRFPPSQPPAQPQSWGDYFQGLGREAVQSLTFDLADELGIVDREASKKFAAENPVMSTVARIVGGVPLFAAGPGAAAARWAVSGSRMLPRIGRSATLGSGLGTVSGLGAGEGDLAERLPSAQMGGVLGLGLGAVIPPAAGVAGWAGRQVGRAASTLADRFRRRPSEPLLPFNAYSEPIEGARFVADGVTPAAPPPPADIGAAQQRAVLSLRDAMLRGGTSPEALRADLDAARAASRPHSSGRAQTVTTLGDLNEALTRQAGVFARQSPESAREMTQVMQARQTGITPMGADEAALAQRGIPSLPRLSDPITGRQARDRFGTDFGAGLANEVPMGHQSRMRDWLERFYLVKDKKHHGFGRTGIETMEQAAARADALSKANYAAAYKANAGASLRAAIDPVFDRWAIKAASEEAPTVERAVRQVAALFRPGKPINLEQFDKTKRVVDNLIKANLKDPAKVHQGGLINDLKNDLLAAVDEATGGAASLYAKARRDHAEVMTDMRAYLLGRHAHSDDEALRRTGPLAELTGGEEVTIRHFNALTEERKKLFRQGHADNLIARMPRDAGRSGLRIFNEPRVLRMIRDIAPAESSGRAELLGRYIDFEGRMPETRHVAVGNSLTAMRVQDDLMALATEASQNVQSFVSALRGNQSLYQLGERLLTLAWDRAFGVGANAAREGARMLFTANPAEIEAVLQQVAARWPASRMAHFNTLLEQIQRSLSPAGVAGVVGATSAPTPQPQGGPYQL